MELNYIIGLVTVIVTLIAGELTKKYPKIDKKKVIPIQNLVIGLLVALINWIITKDFNASIAVSGLFAGGVYDLVSNLKVLSGENEFKDMGKGEE